MNILVHFQEKGQTVTSARYSDMLVNELKPTIQLKCWRLLSKRVLLLHDNACLHTAARTVDTLHALKFEVLKHPPFSLDLVPSDFHLFGPTKEHLWGQKFEDDNEVLEVMQSWLKSRQKAFFWSASASLWTGGPRVLQSRQDMAKNKTQFL